MRSRSQVFGAGFTILESLVVMAIIVLLASIVIPGLMGRKAEVVELPDSLSAPAEESVDAAPQPEESATEVRADGEAETSTGD